MITKAILLIATIWYIAPRGTSTGDGTRAHPWDFQTGVNAITTKPAADTLQVDSVSFLPNWRVEYPLLVGSVDTLGGLLPRGSYDWGTDTVNLPWVNSGNIYLISVTKLSGNKLKLIRLKRR